MRTLDMVSLQLEIEDVAVSEEKLQSIASSIAFELEEQDARVSYVPETSVKNAEGNLLKKGDQSLSSILSVEVNLENIAIFVRWIYQRIAGTSTKITLKHGDTELFTFEGRNPPTNEAIMERVDRLMDIVELEIEKR